MGCGASTAATPATTEAKPVVAASKEATAAGKDLAPVFKQFDTSGDGCLDADELFQVFQVGATPTATPEGARPRPMPHAPSCDASPVRSGSPVISPDLGQAELRAAYEAHEEERARTHRQYDAAVRAMEVQGHEMRAQAQAEHAAVEQQELVEGRHLHRAHAAEARLVGADAAEVGAVAKVRVVEHGHLELPPCLERRRVERALARVASVLLPIASFRRMPIAIRHLLSVIRGSRRPQKLVPRFA